MNLSRLEERRLLADLAVTRLKNGDGAELALNLAESDGLAAAGRTEEAATKVTKV